MKTFPFLLLTPRKEVFTEKIVSLRVPAIDGELGILADHQPMLALLTEGVVKVVQEDKEHFFRIKPGVLEVSSEGGVLLLVDAAEPCQSPA